MPIAQNPVVTGTPMSRFDIDANLSAVEDYLRAKVPGSDFTALLPTTSRVDGQNFVVLTGVPYDIGPSSTWSMDSTRLNHRLPVDEEATLDFLYYGNPFKDEQSNSVPTGGAGLVMNELAYWQSKYVWERLGNVPLSVGHAQHLGLSPFSWNNWRWNFPAPAWAQHPAFPYTERDTRRFPATEYWDTWKTVPYASMKAWIPGPCSVLVTSWARGTWNMASQVNGPKDDSWPRRTHNEDDAPTIFRMFIDRAHLPSDRTFSWNSNGKNYTANWSPVQTATEVGLGLRDGVFTNIGREWASSTWPRSVVRCVSEIFVPTPGYYTLSLRYDSAHFRGHALWDGATHSWTEGAAPFDMTGASVGGAGPSWGLNLVSRFEASGIQAIAQRGRTAQTNDFASGQFT